MKRKVISEPEWLSRSVKSFDSDCQDIRGLTLKLLELGQSIEAVSALTGVSVSSMYEWIGQWDEKGVGLVRPLGQGGRAKPRLSQEQKQEFKVFLQSQKPFIPLGKCVSWCSNVLE